jgi:hypothetical protein
MNTTELEMYGLLADVSEFLEGQVDVVDGDYGIPKPNRAMSLQGRIMDLLTRYERANPEKT